MLVLLLMAVTGAWAAAKTIDLSNVTEATTANNGDVLTGKLGENVQISIADGAEVTLDNVTINGSNSDYYWAGITCKGDATITLTGDNFVKGFHQYYPGIHIAAGKTLRIKGYGSLTASSNGAGAGIGSGWYIPACGNIVIEGGTIIATGGDNAAGIGGGNSNGDAPMCGNISISGGNITATGGMSAAGIGAGCDGPCGNISITGGTVIATGGSDAAAIGGGNNSGTCGTITITDGVTSLTAIKDNLAPNSIGDGEISGTCGTVTIGGTITGNITDSPYTYHGEVATSLSLNDSEDNSSTLATNEGKKFNLTLKRTLNAGGWNTFCAPFSTAKPSGWTLKKLTGSSFDSCTGKLTLDFRDAVSIEAGRAYLVKVTAKVENPTFEGVTIANVTTTTETTYADFVPVMNPTPLTANDKTVLFVSGGNKLTYPNATSNINGFRAYFQLKGDAAASANAFAMSFDDESTGITDIDDSQAHDVRFNSNGIYTLDGRRTEGQPTAKGIYIQNGRKVIIK